MGEINYRATLLLGRCVLISQYKLLVNCDNESPNFLKRQTIHTSAIAAVTPLLEAPSIIHLRCEDNSYISRIACLMVALTSRVPATLRISVVASIKP